MRYFIKWYFVLDVYENNQLKIHENFDDLYATIKTCRSSELMDISNDLQHSSLLPQLRPYQKDAITWMIYKETNMKSEGKIKSFKL